MLFSEPKIPQCRQSGLLFVPPLKVSVLFSEPKIPQSIASVWSQLSASLFQCSSASRKFLNPNCFATISADAAVSVLFSEPKIPQFSVAFSEHARFLKVSVLFSEPKIPQSAERHRRAMHKRVSVLFSEPKIPQCVPPVARVTLIVAFQCSSASRKFLNSDNVRKTSLGAAKFQCSSASRKFLNQSSCTLKMIRYYVSVLFSEPKIPQSSSLFICSFASARVSVLFSEPKIPQYVRTPAAAASVAGFSALQRAENSSMAFCTASIRASLQVSVLFSEPKIPQFEGAVVVLAKIGVSVLFSEPKIPQSNDRGVGALLRKCFSALQRAENSSIHPSEKWWMLVGTVSVLFSEPKIPQSAGTQLDVRQLARFSALQRAENSSISCQCSKRCINRGFSALQRAENSSIVPYHY